MNKISARAARLLLLALPFLVATGAHAQSAPAPPKACAAVLEAIASDHVAANQFAGLRNTGAILCFSELAPVQLAASTQRNGTPAELAPVSLTSMSVRSSQPSEASLKLLAAGLNKAQEKINRDLQHLELSGADYEGWRSCIKKEFSAEQVSDSSLRTSKFFTYWIQLAGIVFKSETMNCEPDASILPETAVRELWPTRAEREQLNSKYRGLLSDVKTDENRRYWGLKLLDSIDEYRIALKLFNDESSHLAETAPRTSAARLLPASMFQPASCKIAGSVPTASGSAMPVTINLCKDTHGDPSTNMQFASVDIYDNNSGNHVTGQPSTLKPNSFVLQLPKGVYDINSTVASASGSGSSKPTVFLYESCANPSLQLCAFITAIGPGSSFQLTVN
jgi:hypothetical protein